MALSIQEQQLYNQLMQAIQTLPVGCPVLMRQDWCEILGFPLTAGQVRKFGAELRGNTPPFLQYVKTASNNLNSYKRI